MLSKNPVELSQSVNYIKQAIRQSIIAEYDAINLYEQLAGLTRNEGVKKILLDIAEEEKVHVGEFEEVLRLIDEEHAKAEKKGQKEVEEMQRGR